MESKAEKIDKALEHYSKEKAILQGELEGLATNLVEEKYRTPLSHNHLAIEMLAVSRKLGNRERIIEQLTKLK